MRENILLIGYGAIGSEVINNLATDSGICISHILVRAIKKNEVREKLKNSINVVSSINQINVLPDFVMECASHEAVEEFGPYFLNLGVDFGVVSTGALADAQLFERLKNASEIGNAKLVILSGAVGGIDALSAAKVQNLEKVIYTSRKPPMSWRGSPAEENFDLSNINEMTIIFQGSARDAARLFPKNANVAATIALAGLGFEKTAVKLIADPAVERNIHQVHAVGSFGQFDVEISGNPLPSNPKSSALTAYSTIRMIKNRVQHICF